MPFRTAYVQNCTHLSSVRNVYVCVVQNKACKKKEHRVHHSQYPVDELCHFLKLDCPNVDDLSTKIK